jgi:hypothetical protein
VKEIILVRIVESNTPIYLLGMNYGDTKGQYHLGTYDGSRKVEVEGAKVDKLVGGPVATTIEALEGRVDHDQEQHDGHGRQQASLGT